LRDGKVTAILNGPIFLKPQGDLPLRLCVFMYWGLNSPDRPRFVGADTLRVYKTHEHPFDYHTWRDLFLDKRYRSPKWNEPFDFEEAVGLTAVAA